MEGVNRLRTLEVQDDQLTAGAERSGQIVDRGGLVAEMRHALEAEGDIEAFLAQIVAAYVGEPEFDVGLPLVGLLKHGR